MRQLKSFRYYFMIFVVATIALFLYAMISWIITGDLRTDIFITMAVVPIIFSGMMFIFDYIFDRVFGRRWHEKTKEKNKYEAFLNTINVAVEENTDFTIEDYRKLRDNAKFQKALKQAFTILESGETEDITFEYLSKKFKKDSNEFVAMNIALNQVKKVRENS